MGYLATWLDWTTIDIAEYAKETTTYSAYYYFWRDELFGRVMRLFKEKTDPIPSKEIEIRLMMQGHCGIAPIKGNGELTAFWGAFNGVSKYFDEKSIEMVAVKEINALTGYVRGGCSPVGMKKQYPTVFHETAEIVDTIMVSAGKIGYQVELSPAALVELVSGTLSDITVV